MVFVPRSTAWPFLTVTASDPRCSGDTVLFTCSSVGGLPLLLDDGVHSYLYGPSSSPVAQVDDVSGAVQYLHSDLLGTPRLVTDAGGAVAGTVSYDAFGNRATYTGTQSAIGFTGNWTDPDTGLLYLRARDYDPATGQFLTVDPAVDSTRQPYAYTGNNPVSRTDPTGLDAGEEVLAFLAGAADGASGGASSMLLGAFLPGYDCFIQAHNTAFQVGSIVTQVAVAVITIVGTAGAGAVLIAAKYAAVVGIKVAAKAALKEAERVIVSAARRLAGDDAGSIMIGPRGLPGAASPKGSLFRFGLERETSSDLGAQALRAEAEGFPHGVSVFSTSSRADAVVASRAAVEELFEVVKTGNRSNHYTINLPKPVTDEIAETFNSIFGRN